MKTPTPVASLLLSPWVVVATLIRWAIIVGELSPEIKWRLSSSPWLQSTIVRPNNLLEHLTEATAIQRIFSSTNSDFGFSDAYRIQDHIELPPLVLAFWQGLVGEIQCRFPSNEYLQHVTYVSVLSIVDLSIALLLLLIGRQLIHLEQSDPWEEMLYHKMPKSIKPPQNYFAICKQSEPADDYSGNITKESTLADNEDEDAAGPTYPPVLLSRDDLNILLAVIYYASPISILCTSMYGSFQNVWVLLLLLGTYTSCRSGGAMSLAAFFLGLVSYAELHNIVFVIPCALWIYKSCGDERSSWRRTALFLSFFLLWTTGLHVISYMLVGKRYCAILASAYGFKWNRQGLNLGVLWYFQMQVFHRFRHYFLILVTGLPYLVLFPIALRLHAFPMVVAALFWWLFTIFRPVPTLYDLNVGLCLTLLCPRSVLRMGKASLVALCALAVPVSLYILDCWLWLETGSGNANYIFFQAMAYQVFVVLLFLDFAGSSLRRDKALRLTQRLLLNRDSTPKIKEH